MAQPPVSLGTAGNFAVLAGSGITNTGPTTIAGDVGTFPTTTETGFGSVTLIGTNHGGDAVAQLAKTDLTTAYNDAAGRLDATIVSGDLGGQTLVPGVYKSASSLDLTGTLTLNAHGNPYAVFIFQMGSTLTTASGSNVRLINGTQSCNVFWQIGSSATLGTGSTIRGTLLALTSITATTNATVDGRLLAMNGAVTLDTNTIARAICEIPMILTKVCPTSPNTYFIVGDTATITLTVANNGSTAVTSATVLDQIFIPADVLISSLTTVPLATLVPPAGPYSNTDIFITWTGLTVPAFSSILLTVTFTVFGATTQGDVITNVDAGITSLSGARQFRCTIPVIELLPPPQTSPVRGLSVKDYETFTRDLKN
jgi:type VI secretion system secreted protein VgrG